MNKILFTISFLFSLFATNSISAEFTQTYDLKNPIRIKSIEIFEITSDIYKYLEQNNNSEEKTISGRLEFNAQKYDAEFDLPMEKEEIRKIPNNSLQMSLFMNVKDPKISSVHLVLSDNHSYVKISGESYDQVVGLLNVIKEKINPHIGGFGGSNHRFILVAIYWLLLFGVFFLVNFGRDFKPINFGFTLISIILLQNIPLYAFDWRSIFPGVLITHDNLSFLQKYSHIFTFCSFLIALIPFGIFRKQMIKKNKKP